MIATPFPFNLLPLIAMFNYFIFFGADLISELRSKRVHYSKTTVNFNQAKSRRSNMSSARRTTPISAVSAAEQTWIFPILNFVTAQNAQATTASVRTI